MTLPLLRRVRDRNPFPTGSVTVAAWLVASGLTTYGFVTLAGHTLDDQQFSALSALWGLAFFAGPGFFQPLEQEVARALAQRRARGLGGRPVIERAAAAGSALTAAIVLVLVVLGLTTPLVESVFNDEWLLLAALSLVLASYFAEHLTRGVLAGAGRWTPYGSLLGVEGVLRLAGGFALVAVGVATAGPYGLVVGVAPFVAVAIALRRPAGLAQPGPPSQWRELSVNIGLLLAGSLLALALMNGGIIAVKLLASARESNAAGRFFAGLLLARAPLYLFQAVQASLLPELSGQRGAGAYAAFRRGFARLVLVMSAIGVVATLGYAVLGPWTLRTFFDKQLGAGDMALLAAGSGLYVLALTFAQALIALEHHGRSAVGWLVGVVAFVVAVPIGAGVLVRVEVAYLVGCAAAAVAMAGLLVKPFRRAGEVPVEDLIAAVEVEPVEP